MVDATPAVPDGQPPVLNGALYDCAAGLAAVAASMVALEADREAVASVYLHEMRKLLEAGRLGALVDAARAFRDVYGTGWTNRMKEAELPCLQSLKSEVRGMCNDGEGRWRGPFPLSVGDPRPAPGTWVVYQLLLGTQLLYIGSTGSLYTRLKAHSYDKEFDGWRAAYCDNEEDCRDLETALIDRYRPPLNRMIATPRVVLA